MATALQDGFIGHALHWGPSARYRLATRTVMRCTCAHPGCSKDFGDPEGHNHGKSNFISWAIWVIGHHEVAHGVASRCQPADVAKLLKIMYAEVPA